MLPWVAKGLSTIAGGWLSNNLLKQGTLYDIYLLLYIVYLLLYIVHMMQCFAWMWVS